MKFIEIENINQQVKNACGKFIENSEDNYIKQLETVVKGIVDSGKHIVLLSGPSGAGKTTTALRIESMLEEMGIETHTISMDNYFLPDEEIHNIPLNEDGSQDLESPYRLNIPLFKEHLQKINACEEIDLPKFNFNNRSVEVEGKLKRKANEIIIVEGIHALNPLVTGEISDFALRLYISVRTRLKNGDFVLHPRKIRLMRRLCRDYQFRNREFNQIVDMFKAVSKGEDCYITPFKKYADFEIDTFLPYEICLYSHYLTKALSEKNDEAFISRQTYKQLLPFINATETIPIDLVPQTSLVREFIGGSLFKY
ncbi:MAG: ATP-binding protein [Oscillospiraceae bacterium]|jgi:uridine kinase|nr:ATP-binding protein [Oscillospiraceae bacterium]